MDLEIRNFPLNQIHESTTNPRKHFDDEFLKELADSIKEKGILEPLLVRPLGQTAVEVVAGAQRLRAAKLAAVDTAPCIVRDITDDQAIEIQLIENLQRRDIHPLDEGEGYDQLLKKGKYTVATLAAKIGKSESYVYQRRKLAELIAPAKRLWLNGNGIMQLGHALLMSRLQPDQQKEMLKRINQECSVRSLQDELQNRVYWSLKDAAFPTDNPDLVPAAGSCVECPKRTGANPLLFPDVKETDTCTDPACFESKERAFVKLQVGTHQDAVLLTAGERVYGDQKTKGLKPQDWEPIGGKKCDHTAEGVIVELNTYSRFSRPKEFKLGQRLEVCTNVEKCKVHGARGRIMDSGGTGRTLTPGQKKQRVKQKRDWLIVQTTHALLLRKMCEHSQRTEDLRRTVMKIMEDYQFKYVAPLLASGFGLLYDGKTPSQKAYDAQEKLQKYMKSAKREELLGFLVAYPITPNGPNDGSGPLVKKIAAEFDIKPAAVEKLIDNGKKKTPKKGSRK